MSGVGKRHWRLYEFNAHSANVNCLSLGKKSGRVLVTGGDDKKVNLWAVGQPNCILSLSGHATAVECVCFDPREIMVCAGSVSGALKVWDLEASKIIRTLTGHKANLRCLDFHPYGDFIASGSFDTNIKLWDARRKGCIYTYKGHSKAVNIVRFSPDGKWVASASEDGSVKLWDLSAGKLLSEFVSHSAAVSDVQFHPNEFLLASGSADRTVKFWDLESFQLVSTTDGDSLPIRCLFFHTSGACLFSGSLDAMKVYGWEPSVTYDSISAGWGKISDMAMAQSQLITASYSMNTVAVHVVQLSTLKPLRQLEIGSDKYFSSSHLLSTGSHIRRSFIKENPGQKISSIEMKTIDEPSNPNEDVENDNLDLPIVDPDAVFAPRTELCRTPTKELPFLDPLDASDVKSSLPFFEPETKPISIEKSLYPFSDIPEKLVSSLSKPSSPVKNSYVTNSSASVKSLYSSTFSSPVKTQTHVMPPVTVYSPFVSNLPMTHYTAYSSELSNQSSMHIEHLQSSMKHIEKNTALRRQIPYPPEAVSIVRPTMFIPEKEPSPQRAIVYPEQLKSKLLSEFVPQQRDRPAGLDVDEFLPKTFQNTLGIRGALASEMSETEAMNNIWHEHDLILSVLSHRTQKIKIILAHLKSKDIKVALDIAVKLNEHSVIVDVLGSLNRRINVWNLDICQILLPSIQDLVESKYESYMSTACDALKVILRKFGALIRNNVDAPPSIGVDLCREERLSKCKACHEQLLSIQSFILKRQTLQGELGQSFRELLKLMCSELSAL